MKNALLLALLLFAAPVAAQEHHPLAGRIWSPAQQRFLEQDELEAMAAQADVVLLGETHDNAEHHALQARMVERLAALGRKPSVAFEMIDGDQRQALDAFLADKPADLAGLGAAISWDKRGWPDWNIYRPIAEAAVKAGGAVKPAGLTRTIVREISRAEEPPELTAQLGLDKPLPEAVFKEMAEEIKEGHCRMLPDGVAEKMVRTQRARDAEMAAALTSLLAAGASPAVLIAGTGHVRADRGVPPLLPREKRSLSVAFLEVRDGVPEAAAYSEGFTTDRLPFDAVWFTKRAERPDPCEQLEKQMKAKKGA